MKRKIISFITSTLLFFYFSSYPVQAGYKITKITTAKIGFLTTTALGVFSTIQSYDLYKRSDKYYELYQKASSSDGTLLFKHLSQNSADDSILWRNISIVSFTGAGLFLLVDILNSLKTTETKSEPKAIPMPKSQPAPNKKQLPIFQN